METKKKTDTKKVTAPKAAKPKAAIVAKTTSAQADVAKKPHKRVMQGVVVSNKMQKTIVVKVDRSVRHGLYGKYVTKSRTFKAHDEKNTAKMGDLVSIIECKPMSREKRWALTKIVRAAAQVAPIEV